MCGSGTCSGRSTRSLRHSGNSQGRRARRHTLPVRRRAGTSERAFFEHRTRRVFRNACAMHVTREFPSTIFYAFRQAERTKTTTAMRQYPRVSTGWETFLEGLRDAGLRGQRYMATSNRVGRKCVKGKTNALASSIVLVCRPRPSNASLATRKEFMNALRRELPEALKNLQHGNIAPVDLAQASIGPGMAVFTRYAKVIESDGTPMTVRTALGIINQVLDEVLAEQEGDFDADTRWALAWFEQYGTNEGPYRRGRDPQQGQEHRHQGAGRSRRRESRQAARCSSSAATELPDDWNPRPTNVSPSGRRPST